MADSDPGNDSFIWAKKKSKPCGDLHQEEKKQNEMQKQNSRQKCAIFQFNENVKERGISRLSNVSFSFAELTRCLPIQVQAEHVQIIDRF